MIETPPEIPAATETPDPARMQGRQLLSYYVLLFVFLVLTKSLVVELNAQFDLAVFPKLASVVQQALDSTSQFDSVVDTIGSLLYAFLFSLPVALVYRITKEEDRFDPALSQTIVLLAMVVTAVIVVISGDLARAFGLAGVVAAVRFRNTLDDAKDAVYVFLAIAIGMACGAKAFTVALWTSILMTGALYFMWAYQFGRLPGQLVAKRESGKKDKKGRKKKKGKRADAAEEQRERLTRLAATSRETGEKKANAGLVVEARDPAIAQAHLERVLRASGQPWHLAHVNTREGGGATLELVGRLPRREEPSALIQSVLADSGGTIERVQFRSLKKVKAIGIDKEEAVIHSASAGEPPAQRTKDEDEGASRGTGA